MFGSCRNSLKQIKKKKERRRRRGRSNNENSKKKNDKSLFEFIGNKCFRNETENNQRTLTHLHIGELVFWLGFIFFFLLTFFIPFSLLEGLEWFVFPVNSFGTFRPMAGHWTHLLNVTTHLNGRISEWISKLFKCLQVFERVGTRIGCSPVWCWQIDPINFGSWELRWFGAA